ncbi:MAG TPA: glycoside hydrolase family 3 N-terminal domain-containing protein [Anaerolineae bacterium]|nr:glycoside hydrolase family 3 N-terminal domain-containing protein [Anaerolineae bacterium]
MKILITILAILLGSGTLATAAFGSLWLATRLQFRLSSRRNLAKLGPEAPMLEADGLRFRDLNKNGKLDVYEDFRQPVEARVADLLAQMTLEEKIGLMFQPMIACTPAGELVEQKPELTSFFPTSEMVAGRHINHCNLVSDAPPRLMARWSNHLQKLAERTRLGIPVSVSTDPRHSYQKNLGAAVVTQGFSQWPDPVGLAATRDAALVREFGDIARQEYLAVGLRVALHPMADLATEPRWARINGTFGEDAELASQLTVAYIQGFQGEKCGKESVSCMLKHFPGGGPQKDGLDAHFSYGREQVYPGNNFAYHLIPFERAFAETEVTQVMPYYGIPMDQTGENVGMAFNKAIITGMLRQKYGFNGVICSDWMICETVKLFGLFKIMDSTSWGVEALTPTERFRKALEAGVDQFGGQHQTHRILELVKTGQVSEARIDESARRLLRLKFQLGLFDTPYVDEDAAEVMCGNNEFREKGKLAQRQSVVLLKNGETVTGKTLPLAGRPKVYVENMDKAVVQRYADVVPTPAEANFAILRLRTPWRKMGNGVLERIFHQGDLDFEATEKARLLSVLDAVPTIVDIYLERGAVIPEITAQCAALLATFNVEDDALLDVIFGQHRPGGKLPFEMPRSMDAVRAQKEDVPHDSEDPLFPFGFGLTY